MPVKRYRVNQQFFNWALLILLAFVWGSSFVLMYEGLFDSNGEVLYTPWQVGAMRIAFAGLILLPVAIRALPKISLKDYGWMALVGLIGNTIPAFCFTYAETLLDTNFVGILNGLTPFFALFIGALLFRSPVRGLQVGGIAVGLIGATGLTLLQDVDLGGSWVHIAVVVVATVCYGMSINIIHHKLAHRESGTIAAFALLTGGVPCAIYTLSSGTLDVATTHPEGMWGMGAIAILGVVGTAVALIMFNVLIQRTSAIFAASVTYLIPVFAMVWGIAYSENITGMHVVWAAVIFSGVYLVNKGRQSAKAPEEAKS